MKKWFFILSLFCLSLGSTAHPIDQETAQAIAVKFMKTRDLTIVTSYKTDQNNTAFFIFNTANGFVIVAADDCETPIIAYSHESQFELDNIPIQLEEYLHDFAERIQYGIENQMVADDFTAKQWLLVKSTGRLNDSKSPKSMAPLITAKWHQGCLYNCLCPTIETLPCGHAQVGCVAVAMGQIMHYWKYPAIGWGSHSYSNDGSLLSADFGNTTYNWELMPDSLTSNSSEEEVEAVATLLFHCGVSVEMSYYDNGSGASSSEVPDAMKRYFSYSKHLHREKKGNNAEWLALLKDCLDQQRPVFYSGRGNGSHAFVCDGYDVNNLLHFNWGWGGSCDGYFALGNLNPNGYDFNNNNYAIFDISPVYEPYQVVVSANPAAAGSVVGMGSYHLGDTCILTATPEENCRFLYWKKDGQIVGDDTIYSFIVEKDSELEAFFSFKPAEQITASQIPDGNDPSYQFASLSWDSSDDGQWTLLKQFDVNWETGGIATDNEYIYITYASWGFPSPPSMFEKYNMDGDLLDSFNVTGIPFPLCIAYDGTDFYCNSQYSTNFLSDLFRVDLSTKTVIDSVDMGLWFCASTYDPEYDGFWLTQDYNTILVNRQGQRIKSSPSTSPEYLFGTGYHVAKDGNPHLLLSKEYGVYDYDINSDAILTHPLFGFGEESNTSLGNCTGKYDGKDALFLVVGNSVCIYEIKDYFPTSTRISYFRIYRSFNEGNAEMIADEVEGYSYIDPNWNDVENGEYRYGISSVFANGFESDIVWSNTLTKTNHGLGELFDVEGPTVQKIFENGHIVIIKNGKRYNVAGQEIQ